MATNYRSPCGGTGVPTTFDDGRGEADVSVEGVFCSYRYQVILYLFLPGVFTRPVAVGFEGVRIEMAENCERSGLVIQE